MCVGGDVCVCVCVRRRTRLADNTCISHTNKHTNTPMLKKKKRGARSGDGDSALERRHVLSWTGGEDSVDACAVLALC